MYSLPIGKYDPPINPDSVFYVPPDARRKHVAIFGKSGTGKSVLMDNMVASDIRQGLGVTVLDPHGSLVEHVLEMIPSLAAFVRQPQREVEGCVLDRQSSRLETRPRRLAGRLTRRCCAASRISCHFPAHPAHRSSRQSWTQLQDQCPAPLPKPINFGVLRQTEHTTAFAFSSKNNSGSYSLVSAITVSPHLFT